MSLTQFLLGIIAINVSVGLGAYAVITINELKKSKTMWEKAYTELAIENELLKLGVMK